MLTRHEKERAATEPAEEDKPKEEQTVEKVGEVPKEEEPQERKLTKAQRRKMKERQKQRERDAMLEQAQNEAGPSARDLECQAIQAVLEPKKLTIQEVASDGHCLYRAIGEQCRLNYQDVREYSISISWLLPHHNPRLEMRRHVATARRGVFPICRTKD